MVWLLSRTRRGVPGCFLTLFVLRALERMAYMFPVDFWAVWCRLSRRYRSRGWTLGTEAYLLREFKAMTYAKGYLLMSSSASTLPSANITACSFKTWIYSSAFALAAFSPLSCSWISLNSDSFLLSFFSSLHSASTFSSWLFNCLIYSYWTLIFCYLLWLSLAVCL